MNSELNEVKTEQGFTPVEWTESALRILRERYLQSGESPEDMLRRVAGAIAEGDRDVIRAKWEDRIKHHEKADNPSVKTDIEAMVESEISKIAKEFYDLMASHKFMPNSPTLMNAGLDNDLQYSACYVLPVEDSIEGIFDAIKHAALIHKTGGGTGFAFSRLRPNGNRVNTSGGVASGPVSFMRVFDGATEAIKQGGRRRGANMGILRVDHPDIEEFISCKLDGGITNFNISVAVTEAFMDALLNHSNDSVVGSNYNLIAQPGWPKSNGDGVYEGGEVIGQKNARQIWDMIVDAAWHTGDPGLIFLDRINHSGANPVPDLYNIETCNPCGEQNLYPNDACNLGSINLSKFIVNGDFDWEELSDAVKTAVHFLDNVITVNPYPLPEIDKMVKSVRRIGLGVMGWADVLFELGIPYNSERALGLAATVSTHINAVATVASKGLSKERGVFPLWDKSIYKYGPELRNGTLTTIAPTGSISIIAGCSSGIEPIFALAYQHKVKQPDGERVLTFVNPIFERVAREKGFWRDDLKEKILETGSCQGAPEVPEDVRNVFVTAHEISPDWHVRMQAAFQKHTDNGVSKTINLPNSATRQDIEDAYLLAYQTGCLGITVFRDGCKSEQVLNVGVKKETTPAKANGDLTGGASTISKTPKVRPVKLHGATYRKKTPVGTAYITVNANGDGDQDPFEVFINVGKAGSDVAADAEGLGRLISLILRLPGPLSATERAKDIVSQLRGIGSGRAQGFGPNRVMSLADGVAQALAERLGIQLTVSLPGLPDVGESAPGEQPLGRPAGDLCPECGQAAFVLEEGCQKCYGCGFSEC